MENQYEHAAHMAELYNLLEDKLSKDIFWTRLRFDYEDSIENAMALHVLTGMVNEKDLMLWQRPKEVIRQFTAGKKRLFLYGARYTGKQVGQWLLKQGVDFYGYCARSHEKYTNGVNGKQVFSPPYVFEHSDECCVLITSIDCAVEIFNILTENGFPKDQVMFWVQPFILDKLYERQYFDFPELFPKGKAFVDAGCFDCGTSLRFAKWCGGDYSKIFAFEPDPENCQQCRAVADSSNLRLELIPSGLSNRCGTIGFSADGGGGSHIIDNGSAGENRTFDSVSRMRNGQEITIQTVTLDSVVGDTEVGFIKMDIEGAEMDALHGAEQTLLRDKPLLAVCVYHRCGDVLAIMDYLHELIPQYHFWLRHYGFDDRETVLYASIKRPQDS